MYAGTRTARSGFVVWLSAAAVVGLGALGWAPASWAMPTIEEVNRFVGHVADTNSIFPPDTMGAIGRQGRFVELLNSGYAQYDVHTSTLIGARMTLQEFWTNAFVNTNNNPIVSGPPPPRVASSDVFDPRILYDDNTQRWYAVSVTDRRSANSSVYVGVTTSSDPAPGNWRGFAIDADADNQQWADFPTLGHSRTGLFVGTEMFAIPGTSAAKEVHLHGIPLASLTGAIPSTAGRRTIENIGITEALQPAVDIEGVTVQSDIAYHGFFTDNGSVRRMEIPSNFFSGGSLGPATSIGVGGSAPVDAPYHASQALTPIDASDAKLTSNVVLSLSGYWGALNVNASGGNNAIRTFQLDPVSNDLLHSDLIQDPVFHFLYPSIAVSPFGEIVVGFNWTWNMNNPSVPFTGITAPSVMAAPGGWDSNGNFSFGIPRILEGSTAAYERLDSGGRNRWGDYSATTVTPNGHDFFTIQEFAHAPNAWATSISQLIVNGTEELKFGGGGFHAARYTMALEQPFEGGATLQRLKVSGALGAANVPDDLLVVGDMAIETYHWRFDAVLDTAGLGLLVLSDLDALIVQKYTLSLIDGDTRLFDTELLQFEVSLLDMLLTLDPLRPSLGQLALFDTPDGTLVEGYIDLILMLLIDPDGDGTFDQSLRSLVPSRLFLRAVVPEPSTVTLMLAGLVGLALVRWRRG
jgi:hypothetical protein